MDNKETIKILNKKQAEAYIRNGLEPIRVFLGFDNWVVYEFDRKSSKPFFDRWCKHELR